MENYCYLIIGGGMTGAEAVKGIREIDPDGSIAVFSREPDPPYSRPPLSKALWKDGQVADIWKKVDDLKVDFYLEHPIVHLNPSEKYVEDRDGNRFGYEKCLLATGGNPRQLGFGEDQILYYRTFADYEKLKQMVNEGGKFAVIGGGFIGAEITAALCMNGQQVSIIFPETGIGANLFPANLAQFLMRFIARKVLQ